MAGGGRLGAIAASKAFIGMMDGNKDEASVVFAGTNVQVVQTMTSDTVLLKSAVNTLTAVGTTRLWDGAYEALQQLILNGPSQYQAILMLSDGNDGTSSHLPQELITTANTHHIRIFTIGLGTNINRSTLSTLAASTGGVYYETPSPTQLTPIFTEISSIISQGFRECKITYHATCSEERSRSVDLMISGFCSGTDIKTLSYTITQTPSVPKPVITAKGPTRFCEGGSVVLEADSGYTAYQWSNGDATRSIVAYRSAEYTVVVTDTAGCTGVAHINVQVDTLPKPVIAASGPTSFCAGDHVTLDAGPGFKTYLWSNGATTQTIDVDTTGTYFVSVTNEAGCWNQSPSVRVNAWDLPHPSISGIKSVCRLSTITYSVPTDTLVGYEWFVDGGTIVSGQRSTAIVVRWDREGLTFLRLTITHDSVQCSTTITDTIVVYSSLDARITAGGPLRFCDGDSVVLDAGAGYAAYLWQDGDTNRTHVARRSGMHTVQIFDANGCNGRDSVMVTVVPLPQPAVRVFPRLDVCEGDTVLLEADSGYQYYRWSNGATGPVVRVTNSDTLTVTVTGAEGCDGTSAPLPVTIYQRPARPVIVESDSTLTAPAAAAYQWRLNGADIAGSTAQSHKALVDGHYSVLVTDQHGCTALSDEFDMVLNQYTIFELGCPSPILFDTGENIALSIILQGANIPKTRVSRFRAVLRYDRNAIALLAGQGFPYRDVAGQRYVTIEGSRESDMTQGTLAIIRFVTTLGDSACAHIYFDSLIWIDATTGSAIPGPPRITLPGEPCEVCMDICHAGGDRLFIGTGAVSSLSNHPNPFNPSTTVIVTMSEDAHVSIDVTDLLGRKAAGLFTGTLARGVHAFRFEAPAFGSGIYVVSAQTNTGVVRHVMEMVK
jgi:hypothetical protein